MTVQCLSERPVRDLDGDVGWVLQAVKARVSAYPRELARIGLRVLDEHRLDIDQGQTGNIVCSLPLLLGETFRVDRETSRNIAVGSIFGLLHLFVQDEVMDAAAGE